MSINNLEKDAVMMIHVITLERMVMGMIQYLALCSIENFGEKNFCLIAQLQKSTHAKHYYDDHDVHFEIVITARIVLNVLKSCYLNKLFCKF